MYFFFFKQKTAYEIYQCDWSSDVCSSDLSGQINPAILYYQKALKYQPSHPEISKNLQNLEGTHSTTPFDQLVQDS